MLNEYASQIIVWQKSISINKYNETTYANPLNILGRIEPKHKLIRNPQGEETLTTYFLMTETDVRENDLINGSLVISSTPIIDLMGDTLYYEVYTK